MNMHWALRFGFLACLGFVLGAMTTASDSAASGNWEGRLDTASGSLRVLVHISQAADGKLTGSLDSPDQDTTGIPMDPLTYQEPDLHFAIERFRSGFDDKMKHNNSEIAGEWKQSGLTLQLVFRKKAG
jgi:hypothetical protein